MLEKEWNLCMIHVEYGSEGSYTIHAAHLRIILSLMRAHILPKQWQIEKDQFLKYGNKHMNRKLHLSASLLFSDVEWQITQPLLTAKI